MLAYYLNPRSSACFLNHSLLLYMVYKYLNDQDSVGLKLKETRFLKDKIKLD